MSVDVQILVRVRVDHFQLLDEEFADGAVHEDVLIFGLNHGHALSTHIGYQFKQAEIFRQFLERNFLLKK